jgi:hypothetical protein
MDGSDKSSRVELFDPANPDVYGVPGQRRPATYRQHEPGRAVRA